VPGDGIWHRVARLPDKQRQVIAYRYLADLPFNDIAAIVGGSPAAARRAATDGIKSLRAALAAAQKEGESA
jgi:DNA-directed RNA polymerase specialized sigma24 family protein